MAEDKNQSPIRNQQLKVIGMFKDASPSGINPPDSMFKSNPQYAFDIKNMRFSPLDGPFLFDIVNEKGNTKLNIKNITTNLYEDQNIPDTDNLEIKGTPIGINVFNDELVIFTTEDTAVPIIVPPENSLFQYKSFQIELVDNSFTVRYELLELNDNSKIQSPNISTHVEFTLIDLETNNKTDLVLISNKGELRSTMSLNLSDYTYSFILIKEIKTYYEYNTINSKILYRNIIGLSYLKGTNSNTDSKYSTRILNLSTVINVIFPNYSTEEQTFAESTEIEIISKNENAPNFELINGELIEDTSTSDNFIFTNKENFQSTYKYISYNSGTNTLVVQDNNYPEQLPDTDFIIVMYNKDSILESMPFYYEGNISIESTGNFTYEFNRILNIGSLDPEDELIKTLQFDCLNSEALFTTTKSFTFKQVEITMNYHTEIYSNLQPVGSLVSNWSKAKTSNNILKEGTYPITIKSL